MSLRQFEFKTDTLIYRAFNTDGNKYFLSMKPAKGQESYGDESPIEISDTVYHALLASFRFGVEREKTRLAYLLGLDGES